MINPKEKLENAHKLKATECKIETGAKEMKKRAVNDYIEEPDLEKSEVVLVLRIVLESVDTIGNKLIVFSIVAGIDFFIVQFLANRPLERSKSN